MAERTYAPTDVYDELFSNEFDTFWLVKGERVSTVVAAIQVVEEVDGRPDNGWDCELKRARIEWRDAEGWWLTRDDAGPFEVWEVSHA